MEKQDYYYTIANKSRVEIKIKGSRFIASACSTASKEEAMAFLEQMRTEFYNATHNCYAYRIGNLGSEYRFSDDGEPNGTAGKPILFILSKFDVSDTTVVVTRYFGGTKLGVGPLARAYSQAAEEALAICLKKQIWITKQYIIFCTYEDVSNVKKVIEQFSISYEEEYSDTVRYTAEIPVSQIEEFSQKITNITNARAGVLPGAF
ncbi:MAG: YigZ family protein [Candidatus Kapabacteria bacterium]|nr:YigZ family protein [Candidatus Kapabacteria bacterium]